LHWGVSVEVYGDFKPRFRTGTHPLVSAGSTTLLGDRPDLDEPDDGAGSQIGRILRGKKHGEAVVDIARF